MTNSHWTAISNLLDEALHLRGAGLNSHSLLDSYSLRYLNLPADERVNRQTEGLKVQLKSLLRFKNWTPRQYFQLTQQLLHPVPVDCSKQIRNNRLNSERAILPSLLYGTMRLAMATESDISCLESRVKAICLEEHADRDQQIAQLTEALQKISNLGWERTNFIALAVTS